MPEQIDNQQRKEESKTESYSKANPIKGRLTATFLIIGSLCSLLATWAGAENQHHTTMVTATIVGVISFLLAGYFHWTPDKEQDEIPKTKVTESSLPKASSQQTHSAPQNLQPPAAPPEQQSDWTQYTQDYIQDILWKWHYSQYTGTRPLDLTPYCIECNPPAELKPGIGPYGMEDNITWLSCQKHIRQYKVVGDYHRQYASIEKEILARQAGRNRL